MKIATKDDIEAPIAFVFEQVTDFGAFERQAMRRGANVKRIDTLDKAGVGSIWDLAFNYRGKERDLKVEVKSMDPPNRVTFSAVSGGLNSITTVDLVALSRTQTRLTLEIELMPTNLTSRLLVQSLKLAKSTLTARVQNRLTTFATDIKGRYKRRKQA